MDSVHASISNGRVDGDIKVKNPLNISQPLAFQYGYADVISGIMTAYLLTYLAGGTSFRLCELFEYSWENIAFSMKLDTADQ